MLPDRMFETFRTASQGLAVQREKLSTASRNIANAGTSSPPGSNRGYQPQSVRTTAPESRPFERLLMQSVTSMQKTRPQHFSESRAAAGPVTGRQEQGLGPQFEIQQSESYRYEFDPNHPDADENGMVRYPDIDLISEMTKMVSANRLYEANLASIEAEKEIIRRSLEI